MNLDHLEIFVDLVETLNFRKTAFRKNISQPAVSQAITSVENEIGVQLFQRSRSGVKLTVKGQKFYESIKPLINSYYKSVQEVQTSTTKESALTIGLTNSPYESFFIPDLIRKFYAKFSNTKIFLQNNDHNQLKRQLLNQNCDLILTTEDDVKSLSKIKFKVIQTGYFSALIPKNNKLSKKTCISISDFRNQSLILMDNSWCPPEQLHLQEIIRKENIVKDIAYVNNVHTSDIMCKSGLGITVCPNFICGPENEWVRPVKIEYDKQLAYGVASLKQNEKKIVDEFTNYISMYLDHCE